MWIHLILTKYISRELFQNWDLIILGECNNMDLIWWKIKVQYLRATFKYDIMLNPE